MQRTFRLGLFLVVGTLAACSGLLGLTEPELYPADGGASTSSGGQEAAPRDETGAIVTCSGTDLRTDARNCGECEHDCGRGTCSEGMCQPFVLGQTGQGGVLRITKDDTNLYVSANVDTGGALPSGLFRIGKADGVVKRLGAGDGAFAVARNGNDLYFADYAGGVVARCFLGNCDSRTVLANPAKAWWLVGANGFGGNAAVAWVDVQKLEIAVPAAINQPGTKLAKANVDRRGYVHLFGEKLYYSQIAKLGVLAKGSPPTESTIDTAPYTIGDFTIVGSTIFFSAVGKLERGTLGAVALEGVTEINQDLGTIEAILSDGGDVYVLAWKGLYHCRADDCTSLTRLASSPAADGGAHRFSGFELEASTLWFGLTDGQVLGLAR